jgi:Mn2+/Fe2+ NRAMP family transporter
MADELTYPELSEDLKGGLKMGSLKYFGAGAIMASVTIGSGETFFASRGGAIFGHTLLWCFVASAIMKGVQVYTAGRHIALTGEHPMTHWGRLPGTRPFNIPIIPWLMGILSIACFPFWLAGLPMFIGQIMNWILGTTGSDEQLLLYARCWGTFFIVLAATLTWIQSYGILEKVQTILVGTLLVSILAAFFATHPDWVAMFKGTFVPTLPNPAYEPWVVENYPDVAKISIWVAIGTFLGAIGGGTYDYLGYVGCFREKKWGLIQTRDGIGDDRELPISLAPENVSRGKRWLLPVQIDVWTGFFCVLVFTICFMVLGAEVLHVKHIIPDGNEPLRHQALFVTSFHPMMKYVYMVGVFMAFWGTIYGAYEIYIRTARECFRPVSKTVHDMDEGKFRRIILLYCGLGGLTIMWTNSDPGSVVAIPAIIGGVFTCGIWCFLMIWTNFHFLPKPFRMSPLLLVLNVISGLVLTILGGKAILGLISKMLA